jgi:ABC-type bacteriocin/lantibiotic exporter with double-glycine peptidase domain
MIAFDAVAARYPRQRALAVDGVTLAAPAGQITAVVGPNGSGKSTLVRALLGRIPLERGTVSIDGADVAVLAPRSARACPFRSRCGR